MTTKIRSHARSRVLRILLASPLADLRAHDVAMRLSMSESTLRRRLRAEQTSYRLLLDEVRHYRCAKALSNPRVGGKLLAAQLGFQQTSSFYRAFTKWTGIPWREYKRECVRAGPV